ncbi:MAG TPA: hypothetical protein VKX41_15080 [Alloacidobacterium sp.]|nr:hypothetical protein [Alloacidobacterium sp.]
MRNLSSPMVQAIQSDYIRPAFLAMLNFTTGIQYVWTGPGPLVWNGNTYTGVGSLGQVGTISEATEVRADGTTVTLSGIDPALMGDCLNDVRVGAPAVIYFALVDQSGALIGTPYPLFSGTVDKPVVSVGPDSISISLALESRLTNLQRATQRRYTAADQHIKYPDDTGFNWVEILNDIALRWGS